MKAINIKKLQESFVGKVCTVLTTTVNKVSFSDQQFSDFFTGIIESLDEDGIFSKHHVTGCMSYYSWQYIVGILEEQVISESDIEIPEKKEEEPPLPESSSQYVDIDMLANLTSKAK